jgi:hypothetical protein
MSCGRVLFMSWLRSALLLSLLLPAACRVGASDGSVFRCQSDADCVQSEQCLEHLCRSAASLDGGGPVAANCAQPCGPDHKLCCGTACADPANDRSNCGACGHACVAAESCRAGQCLRETCDNGLDDNGDGLVDCQDTAACPDKTACRGGHCCSGKCASESTAELCSNGKDDDCNGLIDCQDSGCLGQSCAAGKVCDASRSCSAGCFIDGQFQPAGAARANDPCLVCDPARESHAWSTVPAGQVSAGCQGANACDGSGVCRRALAQACRASADCASAKCTAARCVP